MSSFLQKSIETLNGIGSQKASLLRSELGIHTLGDLLNHLPFRYEDRSKIDKISQINQADPYTQIVGIISSISVQGEGRKSRLEAFISDDTGRVKLVWFKGVSYFKSILREGSRYLAYGKMTIFHDQKTITHPEIELFDPSRINEFALEGVYHLTDKLRNKYVNSKQIRTWQKTLLTTGRPYITEFLPNKILEEYGLIGNYDSYKKVHFPKNELELNEAVKRYKFNEMFLHQMGIYLKRGIGNRQFKGQVFDKTHLLTKFYNEFLPFELTESQKKVIKEIFSDFKSGAQMNRLLQGDVGSGKTIVAFICMLLAIDSGAQVCLMAPTEILANQHFSNLKKYSDLMGLEIALLTGNTSQKERKDLYNKLSDGSMPILVGTHALIEDKVQFNNLGFVVIDEQHRFGVEQRAKLWKKAKNLLPHVLVMTATPIPRTLAMSMEDGLDISEITELPAGRKPIKTVHRYEKSRLEIFGFIRKEIEAGRQAYIVYPLIEESETLDLNNLYEGYESICRAFPDMAIGIVHGKMKPKDKDWEMDRFKRGETKILVSTTVIEVGVDVPNASIMIIENSERFGLAQLHQIRGRVGRGSEQSYCILLSSYKLSKEGRRRIETMVNTNNGFEIAQVDLEIRGSGSISGTKQSGFGEFKLINFVTDSEIIKNAKAASIKILEADPILSSKENELIKEKLEFSSRPVLNWSKIS